MPHNNIIAGETESDIWKVIADQLEAKEGNADYSAQFAASKHTVTMDIDITVDEEDPEDEPGTSFRAVVPDHVTFRFRIVKQNLKHDIAKLFGMQDVVIGHRDFDRKFLVQSNDAGKVKTLLSKPEIFEHLVNHPVSEFELKEYKLGGYVETVLVLYIAEAVTEPARLKEIFLPFRAALDYLT